MLSQLNWYEEPRYLVPGGLVDELNCTVHRQLISAWESLFFKVELNPGFLD